MSSGEKTGPSEPSSLPSGGQSPPRPNDDHGPSSEGTGARKHGRRRRAAAQCQVCHAGLSSERPYYQRYRICPRCSTKDRVGPTGALERFCQQCGKFQDVALFDSTMRTCRERLNRHAARRRKAHARTVAAEYGAGGDAYLQQSYGGYEGSGIPHGGAAGVLEAAQAVLQRVVAHRDAEHARYMPASHELHLQNLQGHAAGLPAPPPRPVPGDLLTPLLEPRPVRFHPPLFLRGGHSHLVDPAAAQARLKAVLASATAALDVRRVEEAPAQTFGHPNAVVVEEKPSSELEATTNAGQALQNALEWLVRRPALNGSSLDGAHTTAPANGAADGASPHASGLHSALGAALAGMLQRQVEEQCPPGEGGGS